MVCTFICQRYRLILRFGFCTLSVWMVFVLWGILFGSWNLPLSKVVNFSFCDELKVFEFLKDFLCLCALWMFIVVVHGGLELFLKLLDWLNELFELNFAFAFWELDMVTLLCEFLNSRKVNFLSETEFFHKGFLLLKWIDNAINLGFSSFYSFL